SSRRVFPAPEDMPARKRALPPERLLHASLEITVRPGLHPVSQAQTLGIPYDVAVPDRQHTSQFLIADQLSMAGIQKAELPLLQLQHGNIRDRAFAQCAQLRPVNRFSRSDPRALDDLLYRHSEVQQF